jgi:sugar phosphate permease
MDRKLARRNLRSGLIAGAICLIMFGMSFLAAAIYVHA